MSKRTALRVAALAVVTVAAAFAGYLSWWAVTRSGSGRTYVIEDVRLLNDGRDISVQWRPADYRFSSYVYVANKPGRQQEAHLAISREMAQRLDRRAKEADARRQMLEAKPPP